MGIAAGGRGRPAERQREIAEHVVRHGSASAADLAGRFGVSLMTVHRDLAELERRGVVRKYRGGVTAQPSSVFESNVAYRLGRATAAKEAIARAAAALVEPGMAVMLDDSTSALALARLLRDVTPLTVITNFMETIRLVTTWPDVRLIALGGEYDALHDSFLGVPCVEAVAALRADLLFTSTSAVSGGFVYHQEQDVVLVKRAMLAAAGRRVLLVDHTKLGRVALHRVAPLTDFHTVVTDAATPDDLVRGIRDAQVPVLVAQS